MASEGGGRSSHGHVIPDRSSAGSAEQWGSKFDGLLGSWEALAIEDREVATVISREVQRERRTVRLVASENYASPAVLAASSTTLTNKYANGYPGRRKYPGCKWADEIELLAIARAKAAFGGDHVNVQPHSGSQANLAAYLAILSPGDTLLTLHPDHGGHFTHGRSDNFSSVFFRVEHFTTDPISQLIDLAQVKAIAQKVRPAAIVVGSTSYPRSLDFEAFAAIARDVGAKLIVDAAHVIGLVAGGVHPDPVGVADVVTFTTHKTLRGPCGGAIICKAELADRVDAAVFPLVQGGPNLGSIAAKAVAFREALEPSFSSYARRAVSLAAALASVLSDNGLRVLTGGTDTHIVLVDVTGLGITGQRAEAALARAGILANRCRIPFDPLEDGESGIRFGTAALATLGLTAEEMANFGNALVEILRGSHAESENHKTATLVASLCERLAPYADPFEGRSPNRGVVNA